MSKTLIHNIGTILSGDFENPILAGDTVCTDGDKIVFIGSRADAPALSECPRHIRLSRSSRAAE